MRAALQERVPGMGLSVSRLPLAALNAPPPLPGPEPRKVDRPSWDEYKMSFARAAAARGTCRRLKAGAAVFKDNRVVSTGYNGSPPGHPHCTDVGCLMVNGHCRRTTHAEKNALMHAASSKGGAQGAEQFITVTPCYECARDALSSGIVRIVFRDAYPVGAPLPRELVDLFRNATPQNARLEQLRLHLGGVAAVCVACPDRLGEEHGLVA